MNATLILPITLTDLSPRTRDWLLAKSARLKVPPMECLNQVLEKIAAVELKDGRQPLPADRPPVRPTQAA